MVQIAGRVMLQRPPLQCGHLEGFGRQRLSQYAIYGVVVTRETECEHSNSTPCGRSPEMDLDTQEKWIARLSEILEWCSKSTRADRFLFVGLERGIEQRSKCFRQIAGTHDRRADTAPASFEHLEPQRAVLDARREEESRGRSREVVEQRKGISVWQCVLAEYEVELCRADQMARVSIRAGELAAAATSFEPFQQVRRASRGLADEKYRYWFCMHIFCLSGEARLHQQLRGSVFQTRALRIARSRSPLMGG